MSNEEDSFLVIGSLLGPRHLPRISHQQCTILAVLSITSRDRKFPHLSGVFLNILFLTGQGVIGTLTCLEAPQVTQDNPGRVHCFSSSPIIGLFNYYYCVHVADEWTVTQEGSTVYPKTHIKGLMKSGRVQVWTLFHEGKQREEGL